MALRELIDGQDGNRAAVVRLTGRVDRKAVDVGGKKGTFSFRRPHVIYVAV